jgi:(S)-2-hydroxyglutarate dehydrogenase
MLNDFLIVGGGIVGLATALKLQEHQPQARVCVLEKEVGVGRHQSSHNSGVLHCGLYYKPGSLKARLAVEGIREMVAFCREQQIPHDVCGKVVVATSPAEEVRLDELLRRGVANGLEGLRKLDPAGLRAVEPHAAGLAAILVPQEGIVDFAAVCERLARIIQERGGEIVTRARVTRLKQTGNEWRAVTEIGAEFKAGFLVNCAGLHCDRVSALAGEKREVRIVPFRGEYYRLKESRQHLIRHLIYPVPDPVFPFLGVHCTRLIGGGMECGPNASLAFAREGYSVGTIDLRDLADILTFPGFWRFLKRHPARAASELAQTLSRERFCRALQKLVPEVQPEDLVPRGAGVRAQAMSPAGELVQDFHILRRERALHLINAPSPAATASLAIGNYIARQILQ